MSMMMIIMMIVIVILLLLSMNIMIYAKKLPLSFKKISLEPTLIPLSSTITTTTTSSSSSSSSLSISNDINYDDNDMKSATEIRNARLLSKFKIRPESASIILENPRMKNIDIEERILELHSTIGLTKPKLKVTLDNYPSLAVDMLSSPGNYQYLLLLN